MAAVAAAVCSAAVAGEAPAFSNPIFEGWYADPQIRRFGDKYWVFPTTSTSYVAQTHFDAFSSRDLKKWTKHPRILTTNAVAWAQRAMWAPDAHEKDGRYYIFFAANDTYPAGGKSRTGTAVRQFGDSLYGGIGVAVADRPEGPYRDLIGKPLIDQFWNRAQPIDQYVFKYRGGWYMIYGGWGRCNLVRLADDFKSLVPFEDGSMWRDMTPEGYTEGSVMFERKGRWYFMYSGGNWTRDDYCVNYSVGDTPFGPFKFKGKVLGVQRPVATGAGHHSVICVPGTDDWYICYHRRPIPTKGRDHRIVCIDRMKFDANGDIMPVEMTPSAADRASDGGATANGAETLDLGGVWRLVCVSNGSVACDIRVPGDVHSALYDAKLMPDPYRGCNETNVQWIAKADWALSRSFCLDASFLSKHRIVLEAEDVDTFAEIYVNGVKIGETSDRFVRWTFDVKSALKEGRNEIRAVFRSAWREADRRAARLDRKYPMSNVPWAKNQALVRKPACHAGWDWGPAQMTTGFCGPVKLIAHDGLKVEYVYSDQKFNDDFSHCDLTVFADVTDAAGRAFTVTNRVAIPNPPLWWPNGAGERKFYEFEIDDEGVVATHGGRKMRIGLRKVEIVNTPDVDAAGKRGARMAVKVNGRELFMKGANWIPCDAFESRQTNERYRDLLESAVAANMNMIRLWGGGQYERDAFYDICDELGLLVWHDMMCSCAVYPADDWFLGEIRAELSHQLRRLRDHASIALWCGDNECLGAITWFDETKKDQGFYREQWIKRSKMQDEMVMKYDPDRTYWPSSPCAGPGSFADNWKNDSQGDMHNWQVWHHNRPFDAYYAYSPRFCSEFGYQSFPSMEVAETFATREQIFSRAPEFEWHQKNPGGNRRIRETMLRYFKPPKNVESELLLSQFQQGMAIKMAVDGWRAQRPRCMGTLFWQLNDNWPVASWSSIEYGGKWKPLQYMAKRFYAPIAVVAQPYIAEGKADVRRGRIFALNDTAVTVRGELTTEYWTYDGRVVASESKPVTLPPDSSMDVGAFATPEGTDMPATFLVVTLKAGDGVFQNDWHFGYYKDMPLAKADVKVAVGTPGDASGKLSVTLFADKPAFFVWANVPGVRGDFDDNAFTLLPGRPKMVKFTPKGEAPPPAALKAAFSVVHLAGICD